MMSNESIKSFFSTLQGWRGIAFASLSIYIVITVILLVRKKKNILEPIISLGILFSCLVMLIVTTDIEEYKMSCKSNYSLAELSILDMQANTLAISGIAIALGSVIIAILSFVREKKVDKYNIAIENNVQKIKQSEELIKTLTNVISIQFIEQKNKELYFDVIRKYIDKETLKSDHPYKEHLLVAHIGIKAHALNELHQGDHKPEKYEEIVNIADSVIQSPSTTDLNRHFAYLEGLHALYQMIKYKIQIDPKSANNEIKKAQKYLGEIAEDTADRFGHIANLRGLIYYWSGIAAVRTKKQNESNKLFKKAIYEFDNAIKKNPHKVEFLNHRMVALQQLFDQNDPFVDKYTLEKGYRELLALNPEYSKSNLNYASYLIREVNKKLKLERLDTFPDFRSILDSPKVKNLKTYIYCMKMLKEAEEKLQKCQAAEPTYINGYYKMVEMLTIKLLLIKSRGKHNLEMKCINQIQETIEKADEFDYPSLPLLYCKCAFYKLNDDEEKADETYSKITTIT